MSDQVWRRLQLLFAQGVGRLIGADVVQSSVLDGETIAAAQRVEPYGLSYHPKPGCEVYMVFPGGDRAQGVALLMGDKRYQLTLAEGEVALHDADGNFVKLGEGGMATVKASAQVIADTPLVKTTGNLEVGGTLQVAGLATFGAGAAVAGALTNNGTAVGAGHRHTSGAAGTPTSAVIG